MLRLPEHFFRLRPVRIGLIVFAALFLLYTAFGFWLVPRLVRSNLLGFASEQYHRTATLGEVRFNPYTLALEMKDFSMPDADGAQLLGFDRLLLNFDISSVWKIGASFADVELDHPFVRVMLRPDGSLNLIDLTKLANPPPPSDSKENPRVFIDRLSVNVGRVAFQDHARTRPFSTELRPINFELRDFSTGGESGNAYSLRAASAAGESFAWSGTFQLTPFTSSGKFEIAALQARTIWSYLSDSLPFEFTRGVFGLDGEYFYTAGDEGGLRFDVHKVSLTDFGMRPPGRDYDYIELASLTLEDSKVNLGTRRVDIGRVRLDNGGLHVKRDAQANINLAELAGPAPAAAAPGEDDTPATATALAPAPETAAAAAPAPATDVAPARDTAPTTAATPTAPASPPAPDWVVAAPDIAISNLLIDVEDSLVKPTASFKFSPVNITVAGYDTAPGTRFTVDMDAKGDNNGDLKVHAQTDAGLVAYTAHVEANEFALASLQPYLSTYTQITLKSGQLSSAMDIDSAADGAFKVKGDVVVNKLSTIDNALKQDLLKWDRLAVTGLEYGNRPERLAIARIDAAAPYARLIIAPDETLNITQLFTPASGSQPAAVQTVNTAEGPKAAGGNPGGMRVSIGTIKLIGGSANFADYWIKPNYAVSLQELGGTISGLSSDPKSRAKVDLKGRVDRYAPAEIAGELNLLSAALYTDMHVKFDGVEMTSVTPYSGHFAGYAIEKGKLSIDVNYLVKDRQLTANQKFVIDQLQLGDRVESADAVHLPLKLAVALLKDRNGVIDIDLPLSGSLDDPQFRVGPLIWKAFVGLLGKIATSPFTLLAKLGGGKDEQINQVDFAPGSAELDAAAQERMTALAKALTERPALELEVPTAYAPDADGNAIGTVRLEQKLATYGQAADGDAAARFDLLRKAFDKEMPAKTPLPAGATLALEQRKKKDPALDYATANQELTAALLQKYVASEAELGDLARARADAIRESLVATGAVDAKRVFVLGAKPVAAVDGKVRAELTLK
ncbi:MAG TPA: DUF748 domain-containing protein [Steroidobacteraceae bacterium]|nr:DUF748 domain-containing protein [Steroidobacteraceae bacterium]